MKRGTNRHPEAPSRPCGSAHEARSGALGCSVYRPIAMGRGARYVSCFTLNVSYLTFGSLNPCSLRSGATGTNSALGKREREYRDHHQSRCRPGCLSSRRNRLPFSTVALPASCLGATCQQAGPRHGRGLTSPARGSAGLRRSKAAYNRKRTLLRRAWSNAGA